MYAPPAILGCVVLLEKGEFCEGAPNPLELLKVVVVGCWLPKGLEDWAPKGVAAGCWLPKGVEGRDPKGVDVVGVPKGFLANGFAAGFGDGLLPNPDWANGLGLCPAMMPPALPPLKAMTATVEDDHWDDGVRV